MDVLRQLLSGSVETWGRLSVSARVNLAVAGLASAALIGITVFLAARPQYVRLYDGVDPAETAPIADILAREGIGYRVGAGEHSIQVPLADRSRARLAVSSRGLPSSQGYAPGFELFNAQDMSSSRRLQDVNYMRAVRGELQRQLNEFSFINKSFVFIREAENAPLSTAPQPSRAAVTLDVRRPLTNVEIKAVLHTICSFGGARLGPGNITLTTTDGTPLHLPPASPFASLANSNLEYIAELERMREERVLRDFDQLGVRALVKVSADVDFTSKTETVTKAEEGAVVRSHTATNTKTSGESPPRGAAGAMANLPEGGVAPGGIDTKEQQEDISENFQPTMIETKTTTDPGRVKRYLVSAIIEGETRRATGPDGRVIVEYVPPSPGQKALYEKHIAAAVGDGEEPTVVTVSDHPFKIDELSEAQQSFADADRAQRWDLVLQWGRDAGKLVLVVLAFWLARRVLLRAVAPRPEEACPRGGMTPADLRREAIAAEVERLSQEEPASVAVLLRSWLAQDEE